MLYSEDFVSQTALELKERFESPIPFAEYAVDIDGGPGNVDILDLMEYLQDSDNSRKLDPLDKAMYLSEKRFLQARR